MSLKESEAIVLRTYPFREADLLVTLFTRSEGKVRGAARAAKKSRRRFGGALEPLTYVKIASGRSWRVLMPAKCSIRLSLLKLRILGR
jgi:DNA repair protein RecO